MSQCICQPDIERLHDGELDDTRAQAVREHAAGCGDCSRDLHELEDLSGWFRADQSGDMNTAELARLHAAVDRVIDENEPRLLMFPWVKAVSAAAASFVVIAAAWMAQGQRAPVTVVQPASMPEWASLMFGEEKIPGVQEPAFADADLADYFLENLREGGPHAKAN